MPNPLRNTLVGTALAVATALPGTLTAMTPNPGLPVKKIPFASELKGWQVIDPRQLVVSRSNSKNYLVTLQRDCHTLGFARQVGFSSSNNTIYAGFDYVTADGQRCGIKSINKISKAEKKALVDI